MKNFTPTKDLGTGFENVVVDADLEWDKEEGIYVVSENYIEETLNESMKLHLAGDDNSREVRFRASRQLYNYVKAYKSWPEDWPKKKHLLTVTPEYVDILKRLIRSHIESILLTRRDKIQLEIGIDLNKKTAIEDFDKVLEEHQLALPTVQILHENDFFRYLSRIDQTIIDIGVGW